MISQRSFNYAKLLVSMDIKDESIELAKSFLEVNELREALENPAVKFHEKEAIIDSLFSKDIQNFLKVLCENKVIGKFTEIMEAYEELKLEKSNTLKASLFYVVKPDDTELTQIKTMLEKKYNKKEVILNLKEDTSLVGGFVLQVGNIEYDKSIKGALSELQNTLVRRRSV